MNLLTLFFLSVAQNAAFTWSARSKNSADVGKHAIASLFSNSIFFAVNFFTVFPLIMKSVTEDTNEKYWVFIVYVLGTVAGSCLMMSISIGKIYIPYLSETDKDKVGATRT